MIKRWLVLFLIFCVLSLVNLLPARADEIRVTARVTACGTAKEECEGADLRDETCQTLGFDGGILSCSSLCTFNTSQCTTSTPPSPPPSASRDQGGIGGGLPFFLFADFNGDGRVDFSDFSILLFWWNRTGLEIEFYDLNRDGKINIVDLSIFLYYWTS